MTLWTAEADRQRFGPALAASTQARVGRSLASYLVLPRPKDAVKWWILPITFALGALGANGVSPQVALRALVVWFVLELLIYQARYQWNDIRGFDADQRHPDANSRGRLPGPPEQGRAHKLASGWVAFARVVIAAAIGLGLPRLHLFAYVIVLTVAVFGLAILYERLRDRATGRTGCVPPPLRPAIVGVWLAVGGGYAIRGVAGLALAVDLTARPLLASAAVVTMWAYGIAFVTSRWAIEALAFARCDGQEITWIARAEHAREHLSGLVRWLPSRLPDALSGMGGVRAWRPLENPTAFMAPWNLATIVAAMGAAMLGQLLGGPPEGGDTPLAIAAAGALALIAIRAPAGRRGAVLVVAFAALWGLVGLAGTPRLWLAALPWGAVMTARLLFSSQCLDQLGQPRWTSALRRRPSSGGRRA